MARHDTWMPLYVGDYLADTMHLTTRQHGAYLLLILACWKNGGAIPSANAKTIARLSDSQWQEDSAVLAGFFEEEFDGLTWCHRRVADECAKALKITESHSKAGSKGAANRWQGHRRSHRQTDAPSPSPSPKSTKVDLPRSRKTKLPEDWKATEDQLAYASNQGCPSPKDTAENFKLYHLKEATLSADWNRSWQYWCRNEKNFRRNDMPKSIGHSAPIAHEPWEQRVRAWKQSGKWNLNHGPAPGESGCVVPKQFLEAQ